MSQLWLILKEDLFVPVNDIGRIPQGHFIMKKITPKETLDSL